MDIVAVMAGGNQMDPALLSKLLDPIVDGKADYTIGTTSSIRSSGEG